MPLPADITIQKSARRSLSIQIMPDGSVVVKAPTYLSSSAIQKFIDERREWIDKHLHHIQAHPRIVQRHFVEGESFLYLGNDYILKFGDSKIITPSHDTLLFPQYLSFRAKKEVTDWYLRQAKSVITERVISNAKQMNVNYKSISFSDTKSKWGSCSYDNHLQFCWRLIMSPLLVINYVVIHELVHTMEKNHSDAFWTKVRNVNPSYKQQIKWLKQYGHTLVL